MKNRSFVILLICLLSLTILWYLCPVIADRFPAYDGHLPSQGPITPTPTTTQDHYQEPKPIYEYYTITDTDNNADFNLSMHILEVDPSNPNGLIKPVSSHNTLFGYAYLSEIDKKWQAEASVNGGFSHPNGLLGGLYIMDDELFTPATGQYPVLFMSGGTVFFREVEASVWLEGEDFKLESFYYNQFPKGNGLYLFTPAYGSKNRIDESHLNAVISNGEVRGLVTRNGSYEIPKDGFLISAIGDYSKKRLSEAIKPGMMLKIVFDVQSEAEKITGFDWAYECGSWIIRDGKVVVPDKDNWVGTLKTRTPRTAVGIKEDGTLVFVVVDGRQKDLSEGLTGEELAQSLLSLDIKDAAFLDGGASSEMIVEGQIVNSPSAGRERMIASGFVLLKND